ncbi:hypothetical protein MJM04_34280, partial [Salmonella enterica subsp. enterica serovar Cerro]|nr:hypothetical protein [Salmonella enterica subsp. enterica serovar Cerro]
TDIVAGVMQAMHAAADTLHMPWLIPVMAICMFFGALGQINSWPAGGRINSSQPHCCVQIITSSTRCAASFAAVVSFFPCTIPLT